MSPLSSHKQPGGEVRDPWGGRLSEYLDDDLPERERRQVEEHLSQCAMCASELEGLRQVITHARALDMPSEPDRDLWPGIQSRLRPRRVTARARWSAAARLGGATRWSWPGLAVAATLTLACVATLVWFAQGHPGPTPPPAMSARTVAPVAATQAEREYDDMVADLRRVVHHRLTHDPRVIEVIEDNLAVIDVAIAEYRDALARQPSDPELNSRLDAARRRKLVVLRQASADATNGAD